MSKKSLLNEAQIRQFMKLASLEPLTPGFVGGLKEAGMYRDDEGDLDESHGNGANETNRTNDGLGRRRNRTGDLAEVEAGPEELDDFAADDLADDSLEGDEEAATDELEADVELGAEAPAEEGRMVSVDEFLSALETALEGVLGDEVEIDSDEMEAEEDELEADVEMGAVDDMEMDVEAEDELVEQITKRVAARILKSAIGSKKKSNLDEGLASMGRSAFRGAKKALGVSSEQKIRSQLAPKVAQELAKSLKAAGIPVDGGKMAELWAGAYPGEDGGAANKMYNLGEIGTMGENPNEIAWHIAFNLFSSPRGPEAAALGFADEETAEQYYQAISDACKQMGECPETQ